MNLSQQSEQLHIVTERYTAQLLAGEAPALLLSREGKQLFRLPLAAGLSTPDTDEVLRNIRVLSAKLVGAGHVEIVVSAISNLWSRRAFRWDLYEDHLTFQHAAEGEGQLGRCFFASNGIGGPWGTPGLPGVEHQTTVFAGKCFAPRVNHANQLFFDIAMPQSLGIRDDSALGRAIEHFPPDTFLPERMAGLFCPPPLALAFGDGAVWASVGIGDRPGQYLFNAFDYSGARLQGAAFSVDYLGYRSLAGRFESPTLAIHFGYSPFEVLERSVVWVDARGFGTRRRFPNAAWHQEPIFCGWAEQTVLGRMYGAAPSDLATQANYEEWIATIEERGIPFGTIVIDDKWQEHYGTFTVDQTKWPDMQGFIDRQHRRGRRVLLWVPAHHYEGLDPELCVFDGDRPIAADASSPDYEEFLRERIRYLMVVVGADGFKEDWLSGITSRPGLATHAPLHGFEFLRRFQHILYDEAHACKLDALVETQTPHPLFRESSDVLRLNDLWFATRDVVGVMRDRARIARIAGWPLVDCDNASATCLSEWWAYAQAQPSIGIPSLYFVSRMESTAEEPSAAQWAYLAELWRTYRRERGLEK
jgi:hypothetical protein